MASVTVQLTNICAGGEHLTFTTTGAKVLTIKTGAKEMADPVSDDDLTTFVKVLAKLCRSDKTLANTKTALQAGITVTA